jgi:acyl dehydratase
MKTLFKGQIFSLRKSFNKEEVLLFSNLCGDKNPIHYDEEFCRNTIFRKPIIFGMLGSSLFSNLIGNNIEGSIYISQTLNFLKPIYIDEEVEASVQIDGITEPKKYLRLITQVRKIQKNEIAIDGEALVRIPKDKYIIKI